MVIKVGTVDKENSFVASEISGKDLAQAFDTNKAAQEFSKTIAAQNSILQSPSTSYVNKLGNNGFTIDYR